MVIKMCRIKNSEELLKRLKDKNRLEYGVHQIKENLCKKESTSNIYDSKALEGKRIINEKILCNR